ncbi:unnamed protein product [Callosobruchus maculatus]|uniref:Uncharacterized protein n=1 Tax=Callosobruchus maculatus TaxID=64391 RepID=A0A653DUL8_CALMS|nr:unnamed protein product [Callosobruchus maculatus]
MKFFVAALSLLAVASAAPIYDVTPTLGAGHLGGYGDLIYTSGDLMAMHWLWAGLGGVPSTEMSWYGPYSFLYRHSGLMGIGNDWAWHRSIGMNWYPDVLDYGVHGEGLVGDMHIRGLLNTGLYKHGWSTVDRMVCYHTYGIERCNLMMMHKMMPHMMMSHMTY